MTRKRSSRVWPFPPRGKPPMIDLDQPHSTPFSHLLSPYINISLPIFSRILRQYLCLASSSLGLSNDIYRVDNEFRRDPKSFPLIPRAGRSKDHQLSRDRFNAPWPSQGSSISWLSWRGHRESKETGSNFLRILVRILNMTPLIFLNLFHRSLSRRNTTIIRTLLLCILAYDSPQMNQTNDSHTVGFVLGLASQPVPKYRCSLVHGMQNIIQWRATKARFKGQETNKSIATSRVTTTKSPLRFRSSRSAGSFSKPGSPPPSTPSSSLYTPFA